MFNKIKRKYSTITVIAEFNRENEASSMKAIAKLSNYVNKITSKKDVVITTELQAYPLGYRLTYIINGKNCKSIAKCLSKLSDWVEFASCISKYHYSYK